MAVFLMEHCGEGTIFDLMAKHEHSKLTEPTIIKALDQISHAIKILHRQSPPIIHRDIKIENVLIKNGTYKLCDFGSCTSRVIKVGDYQ